MPLRRLPGCPGPIRVFLRPAFLCFVMASWPPLVASPQLIEGLVNMRFQVSPQLFAVMAAIHVAATDADKAGWQENPIHQEVHKRLAAITPDLRERITKFCSERDAVLSVAALQSKYVSFGLLINGPPDFGITLRRPELPLDVQPLAGFEMLVSELWREADLATLWEAVRPRYIDEIEAYRPLIREMIVTTLKYLRTEPRISLDRQVTFIPELLVAAGQVNARNADHTYIIVVGSSAGMERPIRSIRHEYLHFLLDPLLAKYVAYMPDERPFLKRVNELPEALGKYRQSFYLMVTESLLETMELRLDRSSEEARDATVLEAYNKGLILAPYFSEFLTVFEKRSEPLPVLFQAAIENIRWEKEEKRGGVFSQSRPDVAGDRTDENPRPGPSAEVRDLLASANRSLQSRDFGKAAELLDRAIQFEPGNASALFGLAQIAGHNQDLEGALDLYEKAESRAGEETWIAAWSCVYRGNIYRFQEEFDKARVEWTKALQFKGDLRGAAEAARTALSQPSP